MDTIKSILGEAEDEQEEKKPDKSEKAPEPKSANGSEDRSEEGEIAELASIWTTGNKDDLAQRFMVLDNETAVKVVFAIGREGALELARMVDQMIERQSQGSEEEPMGEEPQETSTEPAKVIPPHMLAPEHDYVSQIMGKFGPGHPLYRAKS